MIINGENRREERIKKFSFFSVKSYGIAMGVTKRRHSWMTAHLRIDKFIKGTQITTVNEFTFTRLVKEFDCGSTFYNKAFILGLTSGRFAP
jgi:hypothetical protein